MLTDVSSSTDAVSSFKTGSSFFSLTVTVTIASSVKVPSETLYVIVSIPLKLLLGVYIIEKSEFIETSPLFDITEITDKSELSGPISLLRTFIITA